MSSRLIKMIAAMTRWFYVSYYFYLLQKSSAMGNFAHGTIHIGKNHQVPFNYSCRVNGANNFSINENDEPQIDSPLVFGPRVEDFSEYAEYEFNNQLKLLERPEAKSTKQERLALRYLRDLVVEETDFENSLWTPMKMASDYLKLRFNGGIDIGSENIKVRLDHNNQSNIRFIITDLCTFIPSLFGIKRDYI